MQLSKLATIRSAPVFRDKAPQESLQGNVRALTIRHMMRGQSIDWTELRKVEVEPRFLDHCLVPGDIIIVSRGDQNPVWLFEGAPEPVCPVGQFHIIHRVGNVDPRYLTWYLNRPATQAKIKARATGTAIQAINKNELLSLELEIPPVTTQLRIAELYVTTQQAVATRLRLNSLDEKEAARLSELWLHAEGGHA
jgi:restriction endonuclease S subunit